MFSIGWSFKAIEDLSRIECYWLQKNPANLPSVLQAVLARVTWVADDHALIGSPIPDLPKSYRWHLERTYGYKVYYRVDGDPPTSITTITIRHDLQRPPNPATNQRYAGSS